MKCLRFDLWGKLSAYETGVLSVSETRSLEAHIFRCKDCKERLARLRKGQTWAKSLHQVTPQRDVWAGIEASLNAKPDSRRIAPYVWAIAASACIFSFLFLFWMRENSNGFPTSRFQQVNISAIPQNSAPHIVTEGFVSEVRIDAEDGDTLFKLVENPTRSEPFVICEIIEPYRLKVPPIGSRVRVFGVSRYDSKEDHRWFEVHPVFKIQTIQQ